MTTFENPTRRGRGDDDRGGQRESRAEALGAVSTDSVDVAGRAAGALLTGQCRDGLSRVPARASSTPGSLTEARGPLHLPISPVGRNLGYLSEHRDAAVEAWNDGLLRVHADKLAEELVDTWWESRERGRRSRAVLIDARVRAREAIRDAVIDALETLYAEDA